MSALAPYYIMLQATTDYYIFKVANDAVGSMVSQPELIQSLFLLSLESIKRNCDG
jgi:hypothetical protein